LTPTPDALDRAVLELVSADWAHPLSVDDEPRPDEASPADRAPRLALRPGHRATTAHRRRTNRRWA
jgi:hypothetical protein